jgi:hypothetical protein
VGKNLLNPLLPLLKSQRLLASFLLLKRISKNPQA